MVTNVKEHQEEMLNGPPSAVQPSSDDEDDVHENQQQQQQQQQRPLLVAEADVNGGGKLNQRVVVLQEMLKSLGDASSAKGNLLRKTIHGNVKETASDPVQALDFFRQIVQGSITADLKTIVENHFEQTFSKVLTNILANGDLDYNEDYHKNVICQRILLESGFPVSNLHDRRGGGRDIGRSSSAHGGTLLTVPMGNDLDRRSSISPNQLTTPGGGYIISNLTNKRLHPELRRAYYTGPTRNDVVPFAGDVIAFTGYESDAESVLSAVSTASSTRNRTPRKKARTDYGRSSPFVRSATPQGFGQNLTAEDLEKWNPVRFAVDTQFVLGSRANAFLGMSHQRGRIYIKYPNLFRYVADNDDKGWLADNKLISRSGGPAYLMHFDDVAELAALEEHRSAAMGSSGNSESDLQRLAFTVPPSLLQKIQSSASTTYEQWKAKMP